MQANNNVYIPKTARIIDIKEEALNIKTFTLKFINPKEQSEFKFRSGQFLEVSVFGIGEAPISISSAPTKQNEFFQLTIQAVGSVTNKLHTLKINDVVGIRGPFGNGFPYEEIMNKDILFIGGGIGLAPLRSLINHILYNRDKFKKITILHGARTPQFILYKDELTNWAKFKDVEVYTTVDRTDNQPWQGEVGLITIFFNKLKFNPKNTYAFVCGPLFMIQIVVEEYLLKLGFSEDNIFSTLERHMKCGVGHCGHCNVGPKYICIDGPVFTYRTMKILPKEF